MTKDEKVQFVITTLNQYYPEIPIPLDHKDPYTLLIAVLLSAQCTDVRVNQITPLLFAKADNPYDMVKLSVEEIKEIIRPCGLSPMKSKGIYGLSHILIDKHNGEVPQSFEDLEALPAVGHKTASVVMSQAFGVPVTLLHGLPGGVAQGRLDAGRAAGDEPPPLRRPVVPEGGGDRGSYSGVAPTPTFGSTNTMSERTDPVSVRGGTS